MSLSSFIFTTRDDLSITQTVKHPDGAPEFRGKVIFNPQSGKGLRQGRMDLIPVQDIVETSE